MKVTVKIDKFGRILIPKKVREVKGYVCGTELSLVMEPNSQRLELRPVVIEKPVIETLDWGVDGH
jgi:bifunctional DNA-binding transcriptional regulator/antitoxin component of YhaV-PrlF toxin-antitoxin module